MPIADRAGAVVCGAGIAGLAAAWQLTRRGLRDLVILDPRPPLSLTSDKSTECYRNWWPDRAMIALVDRSIELLDELVAATGNAIALNRNGYLFATGTPAGAGQLEREAHALAALGAGPLRVHRGTAGDPPYVPPRWDTPTPTAAGADLFLDAAEVHRRFPGLTGDLRAALHTRRCGWLAAQQLGMQLLEQARAAGARLVEGEVTAVETAGDRLVAVRFAPPGARATTRITTPILVDAAGPFAGDVARLLGVELPLAHELHLKVCFDDERRVMPRELPLVSWRDPVQVDWSAGERAALAADPAGRALLGELPAGIHFRPEGGADGRAVLLLWNYHVASAPPRFPIAIDPLHLTVVLHGVARVLPAFACYLEHGRRPYVDGGYYTKTPANRPLIGPLDGEQARGAFVLAALSGFGIMAAPAAGELLAAHVAGEPLPDWHRDFLPARYADPAWGQGALAPDSGQL